jgi:hypothetical protein
MLSFRYVENLLFANSPVLELPYNLMLSIFDGLKNLLLWAWQFTMQFRLF